MRRWGSLGGGIKGECGVLTGRDRGWRDDGGCTEGICGGRVGLELGIVGCERCVVGKDFLQEKNRCIPRTEKPGRSGRDGGRKFLFLFLKTDGNKLVDDRTLCSF